MWQVNGHCVNQCWLIVNLSLVWPTSSVCRQYFKIHFLEIKFHIAIQISLKIISWGPIDCVSAQLSQYLDGNVLLTHWSRVTHIWVGNLTIIGSDNGLSPGRRQAITWTNVGILLIGPLGTNFSEMLIKIHTFLIKKIHLKMLSGKWRPFWLGLNVLMPRCGDVLLAWGHTEVTSLVGFTVFNYAKVLFKFYWD